MRWPVVIFVAYYLLASIVAASQLSVANLTIGNVTQAVAPGSTPLFVDMTPVPDSNGNPVYQAQMQVQNTGSAITVTSVNVALYDAAYTTTVPANASIIPVDASASATNLPTLTTNQFWPGGVTFQVSEANLQGQACVPYQVTLALNTTYKIGSSGNTSQEQDLIPLKLSPNCLTQPAGTSGSQFPVTVKFVSKYSESSDVPLPFVVSFGQQVWGKGNIPQFDPTRIVTVTGSDRTDYVYDLLNGSIYLVVYPDDVNQRAQVQVSVQPGVVQYYDGTPNAAASATALYEPKSGPIRIVAYAFTGIFAGVVAASWITSFVVSSVQPWATAGSLGYGAMGFILWAQKLYLTGQISAPMMPANYRIVTETFAWADLQAGLPWTWGSVNGFAYNLTQSNTAFLTGSRVCLDSQTYSYRSYSGTGSAFVAPPPAIAPAVAPSAPPSPAPGNLVTNVTTANPSPTGPASGPTSPNTCSVLQNTDFFGGDLANATFTSTNPQDCCNACLGNPKCFYWTLSFVSNQCFLKGQGGWQQNTGVTCCLSGTANRNGVSPFLLGGGAPPPAAVTTTTTPSPKPSQTPAAVISPSPNKSPAAPGKNKNGRRLLSPAEEEDIGAAVRGWATRDKRRTLFESSSQGCSLDNANGTLAYIVRSNYSSLTLQSQPQTIQYQDAGTKALYILSTANYTISNAVGATNPFDRLEAMGFWFGCVMALASGFNLCAWLFVRCCDGEMPGILHVPRMELLVLMLSLSAMCFTGAWLLSQNYGLVQFVVGIVLVVCGPLLFLLAALIGIAAAIYRKRKAVYLLSSRAHTEEVGEHSKWDLRVVAGWMGMSLNRGKWRPSDPARKNVFVFRWGPLFEDCRGPLHQRKKVPVNSNAGMSLRRLHTSGASDQSSQSGHTAAYTTDGTRGPSRRKVMAIEEKPMATWGKMKMRRSNFQGYGVVISLLRMCGYALAIGGLGTWPQAQTGVLLFLAVLYLAYLRLVVPYSRRDEMALEYWQAFLDVVLFAVLLALVLAVKPTDYATIDNMGIGLIVVQGLGFGAYLINRLLIIVHAFTEVVYPACACGAPSPKKSRRSRKKSSFSNNGSLSMSMSDVAAVTFAAEDKVYYPSEAGQSGIEKEGDSFTDGLGGARTTLLVPESQQIDRAGEQSPERPVNSRTARGGMFPAITEETDSQVGSPMALGMSPASKPLAKLELDDEDYNMRSPFGQSPASGGAGASSSAASPSLLSAPPSRLPKPSPWAPSTQASPRKEQGVASGIPPVPSATAPSGDGQNAVFDRFWKSL